MSATNDDGVIRIGRKGVRRFAFGDDGKPFDVDVVNTFQRWMEIDDQFRSEPDAEGNRAVELGRMGDYHAAALEFVSSVARGPADHPEMGATPPGGLNLNTAEALDFIARLREQYDELAHFFRPKLRDEQESPDTSEAELQFSQEEEPTASSQPSTS